MKLTQLKNNFKRGLNQEFEAQATQAKMALHALSEDAQILYQALPDIFPSEAAVNTLVASTPYQVIKPNNIYTAEYLPFHTRDEKWLVPYLDGVVRTQKPDAVLDPANILTFIQHAAGFHKMRNAYEENLVKAEINCMMSHTIPNAFIGTDYASGFAQYQPNYDRAFRREVVNTMTNVGLPKHTVDVALEKNAHLWRKQTMVRSFENVYYPYPHLIKISKGPLWDKLHAIKQKHQELWLKHREFEYYHAFQNVIDETNTATPNMKMQPHETRAVLEGMHQMNQQRMDFFGSVEAEKTHATEAGLTR